MRDTLEKDTKTNGRMPSTAVLLTDSALLMPVLHHLPDKDVNVSMGYLDPARPQPPAGRPAAPAGGTV